MSTNATISVVTLDGKVKTIYNHWDGYPEYLLNILKEYYNDLQKAEALVDLGNVSSVQESIECPEEHTFSHPVDGYSIFYGRDRGEKGQEALVQDLEVFKNRGVDNFSYGRQEYNYVYANGQWMHLQEWQAEQEDEIDMFVEDLVDQIHYDLKSDETAAVYELIATLYDMNDPAVTQVLKNYMPQS